ncbi:hypothetical protein BBJ28_00021234 [Nothophytophthora sp. Chile5]|nr:hypothetical protein BBJ28_00021234 [Nothophytophthora sp. Chile5]
MTHAQKYRQRIERRKATQEASAYSPLPCSTSSESVTGSSSPSESDDSIAAVANVEMEQTGGVLAGEAFQLLRMSAIPTPHTHEAGGNFSEGAHPNPPTGQLQPEYFSGIDRHVDIASIDFAPDPTSNGDVTFDSSIFDLPFEIPVQLVNFQQTETTIEIQDGGNAPPSDLLLPELHSQLHATGGGDIDTFPPNVSPDHLVSGEMFAFARPFGGSSFETAMSVTTGVNEPSPGRNWPPDTSSFNRAMDARIADWSVDSESLAELRPDSAVGGMDWLFLDNCDLLPFTQ